MPLLTPFFIKNSGSWSSWTYIRSRPSLSVASQALRNSAFSFLSSTYDYYQLLYSATARSRRLGISRQSLRCFPGYIVGIRVGVFNTESGDDCVGRTLVILIGGYTARDWAPPLCLSSRCCSYIYSFSRIDWGTLSYKVKTPPCSI